MVEAILPEMDNDALLDAVDAERQKFTQRDDKALHALVTLCIARGVYPIETVPGNPNSVHAMVNGWGARWHEWKGGPCLCPKCGSDLRDQTAGPPFMRVIGISENDRVACWRCPDCEGEWGRGG